MCSLLSHTVHAEFRRFRAVVDRALPEPRVSKRFLSGDPRLWVVKKDTSEQIEELLLEGTRWRDNLLQRGVSDDRRARHELKMTGNSRPNAS